METQEFNYKEHHEHQILEWMKNGYGEASQSNAPEHSYNLYVYVRDSTTAVGLLFYLHTLGYQIDDMWVQPWNIFEFMEWDNRFIFLIGNQRKYSRNVRRRENAVRHRTPETSSH